MSLRLMKPDGAMYVYPELTSLEDLELVDKLLERGVAIAPGSGFGDVYKNYIRISACQPTEILAKGLDILASVLKERA
ncbi:MAG TPA: aminotransferase class I/II-fold pyridoxal phosphate-dependent enzyme, partial [Nitrososphaera sp.]|nr:aminotransferase class I/II-fold pyridoxal phosphate-dependent enzyme [Nitrososphaera sp.]